MLSSNYLKCKRTLLLQSILLILAISPLLCHPFTPTSPKVSGIKCPALCLKCTTSTSCDQCEEGTFPLQYKDTAVCVPCVDNCGSCQDFVGCIKCFPGFTLSDGICSKCSDANCLDCTGNIHVCKLCAKGYTTNSNHGCSFGSLVVLGIISVVLLIVLLLIYIIAQLASKPKQSDYQGKHMRSDKSKYSSILDNSARVDEQRVDNVQRIGRTGEKEYSAMHGGDGPRRSDEDERQSNFLGSTTNPFYIHGGDKTRKQSLALGGINAQSKTKHKPSAEDFAHPAQSPQDTEYMQFAEKHTYEQIKDFV